MNKAETRFLKNHLMFQGSPNQAKWATSRLGFNEIVQFLSKNEVLVKNTFIHSLMGSYIKSLSCGGGYLGFLNCQRMMTIYF
jgi:hypothetical protein